MMFVLHVDLAVVTEMKLRLGHEPRELDKRTRGSAGSGRQPCHHASNRKKMTSSQPWIDLKVMPSFLFRKYDQTKHSATRSGQMFALARHPQRRFVSRRESSQPRSYLHISSFITNQHDFIRDDATTPSGRQCAGQHCTPG
jgi:hypothetical protein